MNAFAGVLLAAAFVLAPATTPAGLLPTVALDGRPSDLAGAVALKLLDGGHPIVAQKTAADVVVFVEDTRGGGARLVVTTGGQREEIRIEPGPPAVVRLEAEGRVAAAVARLIAARPATGNTLPSTAARIRVRDARKSGDLTVVRRAVALRLLAAGYALAPNVESEAVTVCVDLRPEDVVVGAAPRSTSLSAGCGGPKTLDRGTAQFGDEAISKIAALAQSRADAALSNPDVFDLGQTTTSVPYGSASASAATDDDTTSMGDVFVPRRAFLTGAFGLTARERAVDPSARILFRSEHGRRLGLGVILDATSATDANVFATELTAFVGVTYAIELEADFDVVLGALGGGRAHIYALRHPLLVPPEGQGRDGVTPELLLAALMGVRYAITPTLALEGHLLFTFGQTRAYATAQEFPLWARAAGGVGAAIGLSWQLPVLEGATP